MFRHLHSWQRLTLLICLLLAVVMVPPAQPSYAAGLVVDPSANDVNDNSDGKCSLWEALQAISQGSTYNNCALSGSEPYGITFKSSSVLKVNDGSLPYITKKITITGPVIIEGNGDDNIFVVNGSAILSIANITMRKGNPAILGLSTSAIINIAGSSFLDNNNDGDGGAISSLGRLNIAGSAFSGNSSDGSTGGGAIYAGGTDLVAIAGSAFNGNIAKRSGGAIYAVAPVAITDTAFNGNIANGIDPNNDGSDNSYDDYDTQGGGAIFSRNDSGNDRKMTLTRTVFNGNITGQGSGGAVYNNAGSTLEIQDSAFNGNLAGKPPATERVGGALVNFGGKLSITRSTFLSNAVVGDGGGIANDRKGELTLSNTTLTANAATKRGGGIFNYNTQSGSDIRPLLTSLNVTLSLNAANSQGGGIYAQAPSGSHPDVVLLTNTIIAQSDGTGGNCAGGGVQSRGHNLDTGTSCGLNQAGDLPNADPKLNAIGFNGGPIPELLSHKLGAGSAAADAGDATVCAAAPVSNKDIRGDSRPKGPICDIGAFEAEPAVAGFGSTPVKPGPITFGNVTVGANQQTSLTVFNTGDKALQLSNPQISGGNAADFAVLTGFPLTINDTAAIALRCQPGGSQQGPRSAILSFVTNDPNNSSVSFDLICNVVPQPVAGFGSTPAAPGPLDFGEVLLGKTATGKITMQELGTATLTVNNAVLGGANPGDFSIGGGISLSLTNGHAPVDVSVSCTPSAPGLRSATLTVQTNDPLQPTVLFNLSCTGRTPPPLALDTSSVTSVDGGIISMSNPYGVAVSPDGKNMYVTGYSSDSVHVFSRDPVTGQPGDNPIQEFYNTADLNGAIRIFASADGKNVYLLSALADSIRAYSRNTAGQLTFVDEVKNGDGYGCFPGPCNGTIAGMDSPYGAAFSPDGKFIYVSGSSTTANGGSSITVLRRTASDGGVDSLLGGANFVQRVTNANLEGVYDLTLSPDGLYLYAASAVHNPDTITVFKRNSQDGTLSYVASVSQSSISGLDGVFRLEISPDGSQLYAAAISFSNSAVIAFQRNPADGKLSHIATYTQNGTDNLGQTIDGIGWPAALAFSPDGKILYVSGYASSSVAAFERDSSTGKLAFIQAIKRNGSGQPPLGGAEDIAVGPEGRTIHVSAYTDNRVVTLARPNPKPTLESLSPASAPKSGDALVIVVNGSDFVPGAKVRWNNATDLATTFINSGKLQATVPAGQLNSAGSREVKVVNPTPGGGDSNVLRFTITEPAQNPVPSITELLPAGTQAGGEAVSLTISGTNFIPGSKVAWNGIERTTTYISANLLQIETSAADVAQPGSAAVSVINPTPGGGTSNLAAFTVAAPGENPVPSITNLSPAFITAGAHGALTLTVLGSNFVNGAQVQWNGEDRPTSFINSGELRVAVSGADLLSVGQASVQVINPAPGGGPSNVSTFRIGTSDENPLPALLRITGVVLNSNGTRTLTLSGSGFIASTTIRWNGANRTTSYVSSSQIKVTISAADFVGGTGMLSASNAAPGGGTSNELLYSLQRLRLPAVRR